MHQEGDGSDDESNGDEVEEEQVNPTEIDRRFIIERSQRRAAVKAEEVTSKLLQEDSGASQLPVMHLQPQQNTVQKPRPMKPKVC